MFFDIPLNPGTRTAKLTRVTAIAGLLASSAYPICFSADDLARLYPPTQNICDFQWWLLYAQVWSHLGPELKEGGCGYYRNACATYTNCSGQAVNNIYQGSKSFTVIMQPSDWINFWWNMTDQYVSLNNCANNMGYYESRQTGSHIEGVSWYLCN